MDVSQVPLSLPRRSWIGLSILVTLSTPPASSPCGATPLAPTATVGGEVTVSPNGAVMLPDGRRVVQLAYLPPAPWVISSRRLEVEGRDVVHVRVTRRLPNSSASPAWTVRAAEAAIVIGSHPPRVIFNGMTGPRGPDADYSLVLQLSPRRVLLFQQRDGWTDCSGRPLLLFPRMYDFSAGRFRAARPRVAAGRALPALTASWKLPSAPAAALRGQRAPLNSFDWQAASSQVDASGRAEYLTPPVDVSDGDLSTAWIEGASGSGVGERLIARRSASPYALVGLLLVPGLVGTHDESSRANRIKTAVLQLAGQRQRSYRLQFLRDPLAALDSHSPYAWFELPQPSASRCVSLTIESVYPGKRARGSGPGAEKTAIAEIRLVTTAEMRGGIEALLRDLSANDFKRRDVARRILQRQGPQILGALEQIARTANEATRRSIVTLLVQMHAEATAPLLTSMLPLLPPASRGIVLDELARQGPTVARYVVTLLTHSDNGAEKLREALVDLLGKIGGAIARSTLMALAGSGSLQLRAATVRALARLPATSACEPIVSAAIEAQTAHRQADLVAAAGHNCPRLPLDRRRANAEALKELWKRSHGFECRFRIVQAIGQLTPEARPGRVLREAARDSEPALRWEAVRRIGATVPSDARANLLRRALGDADPRVRTAAVEGLSRVRTDLQASDKDLLSLADSERWPMVAAAVAVALGRLCTSAALTTLRRLLRHEAPSVGNAAASALAQCAPKALFEIVIQLARDTKLSPDRRAYALRLIPARVAARHAEALVRLLHELRDQARADEDLHLAAACMMLVAASASAEATKTLSQYLLSDPDQTIRAGAAEALARRCGSAAIEPLRRATRDPAPVVRRIAKDGLGRCRSNAGGGVSLP